MPNQLDFNEKPSVDMNVSGPHAPDSEAAKDVKMVLELYSEGKKAKAGVCQDWDKRQEFYDGNQWDKGRAAYRASPVLNIIRHSIQAQLPILTDAKPGFNVVPPEPSDHQFASQAEKLVESWWDRTSMDHTMIEPFTDCKVLDGGILKVIWDKDAMEGAGEVEAKAVDPRDIFVPYGARDFNKECPWAIHRMDRPVGELRREFPKFAKQIKPDDREKTEKEKTAAIQTDVTLVSPTDQHDRRGDTMPGGEEDSRKTAEVLEAWLDDFSTEEYMEENDQGEQVKKHRLKYPRGKLVTILPKCKLRLQGVENPYEHARKPFVRYVDVLRPRRFWGEGMSKSLMGIQRIINKLLANMLDHSNRVGNPVWKIKVGAVSDPDSITNKSGMVVIVNEGYNAQTDVSREPGVPMPAFMPELYQMMLRAAEMIAGTSEITQGRRRPGDPTAGFAIDALIEAAHTRVRLQERNHQVSTGQLGYLVLSLMMQFYRTPRVEKITGEEGWPEYFEYFIEDTEEGRVINSRKHIFNEERDEFIPEDSYKQTPPTKGIFDVKVLAGSSLPFAKRDRVSTAFKMYEGGIIDGPEVLKAVEWPDKEQVERRMEEEKMRQAETQALEGGSVPV